MARAVLFSSTMRCLALFLGVAMWSGCAADVPSDVDPAAPTTPYGSRGTPDVPPTLIDPTDGRFDECTSLTMEATLAPSPVDVIWVIDSSETMRDERARVREHLETFTDELRARALDPRVVVATSAGEIPVAVALGPDDIRIVDRWVDPSDPLAILTETYDAYIDFLRPGAPLHLIVVSDDEPSAMTAAAAESMLGSLFAGRDWRVHAIASEDAGAGVACEGAVAVGSTWYELAERTGGVALSICTPYWRSLFRDLREGVTATVDVTCSLALPDPPTDAVFDLARVNVEHNMPDGAVRLLPFIEDRGACRAVDGWTYDDAAAPSQIELCGNVCPLLSAGGHLRIRLGCQTVVY